MEFLSEYIGGDISEDEFENDDVFQVTKTGADEKDYKSMEDFINQRLKLGSSELESETTDSPNYDIEVIEGAFDSSDYENIEVIEGAFDSSSYEDENIEGAFESDNEDNVSALKSELEDLLKKIE